MKKVEVLNTLTRKANKLKIKVKKNSPGMLIGAGVFGVVASTVMACKATTKLDCILEESKEKIDAIHKGAEDGHINNVSYSEEDSKKDLAIVYTQTGLEVAKLYAPAVAVGVVSLGCILMSHRILTKRNIALAAAYETTRNMFKDYRDRVVERFGKEIDHQLRFNIKPQEIETVVVDENGVENKVVEKINVVDKNLSDYSDYAKFFDVGNPYWQKDAEYNLMFLKAQQRYANDKLQIQGYLFLNEVYEMLGIPKTQAGQQVGWIYDKECPNGDNYVDFGIYDYHKPAARDFVNGFERTILLDFNVDGYILNLI